MPPKKIPTKETPVEEVPSEESKEEFPDIVEPTVPATIINNTHKEAPVSANIKLYSPGGADIMLTVRSGSTAEQVKQLVDVLAEGAKYALDKYKIDFVRATPQATVPASQPVAAPSVPPTANASQPEFPPASAPSAPPTAPPTGNAPGITSFTFQAEKLVSEIKDGKTYWKVVGPPFMKYGVRIWDEVLIESGFALDLMTEPVYTIPAYTAHYVEKEPGKPQKVVKLVEN